MDAKVKICGITNEEDARAAATAGADAVGLMFYPGSPRCISVETARAISAGLPGYVLRVGVFVNPSPEEVWAAMGGGCLNLLQFHGEETPEFCRQFGLMTMKAFRVRDAESLDGIAGYEADAYLLDSYVAGRPGGTGETFNWELAAQAKRFGRPIFLAGGLTPENVAEAVRTARPFAVDVSSGVERAPGKKDHQKMRDFIAVAHGAGKE
jgi:phosphoribosylanthranilate isomerase